MSEQLRKALKSSWPLLIILGIYLALVVLYSWATPPFEGPDEPQHYAYIEWLVDQNNFPPQGEASWDTPVQQESSQPPLYYLLASIPARLVGVDNPRAEYRPNPHPLKGFPLNYPDNDNRAIHYPGDASPLTGGWLALYLARGITIIFGVLLIISIFALARQVVPDQKQVAIAAAFLVAVIPQVVFLSGVASNDIPVAAMSTVTLCLLVVFIRRDWSNFLSFGIGLTFGLSVLIKVSALTLAVPIALAFFWKALYRRSSWRDVVVSGAFIGFGALLTAGWWFMRSWILFGSPLGLETHDQAPWAIDDPALSGEPRFRWTEVFRSFWIWLGWGTIRPSDEFYTIFFAFAFLAGLGIVVIAIKSWRSGWRPKPETIAITAVLVSAFLTTSVFLEIWMRRVTAPYGRLMYPVIGVVAILLIIGWRSIHPKLPFIPIAITFAMAAVAPFLLLKPAYALPRFLSDEEIAEKSTLNWFFGENPERPIVELLSASSLEEKIVADSLLPVELCWRAVERVDENYSMMVHVIGPDNMLVANRRTYPGLGHYPTSIWQPETAWCDLIHILVADHGVPKTLVYRIEVGVLNPELDDRLEPFNAAGEHIGSPFPADVLIVQEDDPTVPAEKIDEALALLDYRLDPIWISGHANDFSLTWAAKTALAADYQLYVHLRDRETGETIAQADGPPLDGWYPTSRWLPGTEIHDERKFYLPEGVTSGEYELSVGFYDLVTGQRFGREYSIGTVEVQS